MTLKFYNPYIGFSQAPERVEGEGTPRHERGEGRARHTIDDCLN
jgi:hypothetical protein